MNKHSNHSFDTKHNDQNHTGDFFPIQSVVEDVLTAVEQRMQSNTRVSSLSTNGIEYYIKTYGLDKGNLTIIDSYPVAGKTEFCLNIATDIGVCQQKNVLLFSLELSTEQLAMRIIALLSKVPLENICSAELDGDDWLKIISAKKQLNDAPLFIYDAEDNSHLTLNNLHSKCQQLASQRGKLDLVIVDYSQLMNGSSYESSVNQVSEITHSLKQLASVLNCSVLALSQLSIEPRYNKRSSGNGLERLCNG